jgi:ribonuclease VapC
MRVFDASAVLAALLQERGGDQAQALMEEGGALIGSVNYAEVMGKLFERGVSLDDARSAWSSVPLAVEPLTQAQALAAAWLRPQTRALGLSLGDRCCLALGRTLAVPIVTADRSWQSLEGFELLTIR